MPTRSGPLFPVFPAIMLFRIDAVPELLIPPADVPELLLTVLLFKIRVPEELFQIPPAGLLPVLPLMVLFEMVRMPALFLTPAADPPEKKTEFPLIVLSVIVIVPEPLLSIPPPSGAELPVTEQRVRLNVPVVLFWTPPPDVLDELFATTQSISVSVPEPTLPTAPCGLTALLTVSPDTVTDAGLAPDARKDAPLMVSCEAPGP